MDIWKHGHVVDLWTLVHILSGMMLGIGSVWLGLPFLTAAILVFFLLGAWEAYEWLLKILEKPVNVASDLVFGMLGFFAIAYAHYGIGMAIDPLLAGGLFVVLLALSGWGFRDLFVHGYR
jgi:hypothetical protein